MQHILWHFLNSGCIEEWAWLNSLKLSTLPQALKKLLMDAKGSKRFCSGDIFGATFSGFYGTIYVMPLYCRGCGQDSTKLLAHCPPDLSRQVLWAQFSQMRPKQEYVPFPSFLVSVTGSFPLLRNWGWTGQGQGLVLLSVWMPWFSQAWWLGGQGIELRMRNERVWLLGAHLSGHSHLPGKRAIVSSWELLSTTLKNASPTKWIRRPAGRSIQPQRISHILIHSWWKGSGSEHLRIDSGIAWTLNWRSTDLLWGFLRVPVVKNPPAMQETYLQCRDQTRVWSLDWEDPLEEEMATQSSILAWRIPWTRGAWWATGVSKSQTPVSTHTDLLCLACLFFFFFS